MNLRDSWLHRAAKALVPARFHPSTFLTRVVVRRTGQAVVAGRADYQYVPWYTRLLPAAYATYAVNEFRPARMSWLWLEPLASTAEELRAAE